MSGNSIGKNFVLTCFGESHGQGIGIVIDGCPPGLPLSVRDVQLEVEKRRPVSDVSTRRRERDQVEFFSGVFNGHTTGAPICMMVWNEEVDSSQYDAQRWKPRPGHADLTASIRYREFNDYRGGGRFSGRITVAFVMAGAVAKKILKRINIEVLAHSVEVAGTGMNSTPTIKEIKDNVYQNVMRCANFDVAKMMENIVRNARAEGDSVGGVVECRVLNLPTGVGDPIFDSLDGDIAKILFGIPAVKGVEFGAGFSASRLKGSENNDQYIIKEGHVSALTNNAGGILGGLSNGMPIVVRVAFKPTPSISKIQRTIDLKKFVETSISIQGRHDTCIVPRAVPVVESVVAITLVDHLLRQGLIRFNGENK